MQQLACSAVTIPRSKLLWLQPAPRTLNCELRSFFIFCLNFLLSAFLPFSPPLSFFLSSLFGTESTFYVTINERMKTCFFSCWSFCRGTCDGKEWIFGLIKRRTFFGIPVVWQINWNGGFLIFGKLDITLKFLDEFFEMKQIN